MTIKLEIEISIPIAGGATQLIDRFYIFVPGDEPDEDDDDWWSVTEIAAAPVRSLIAAQWPTTDGE